MKPKVTLNLFIKLSLFTVLLPLFIFCSKAQDYIPANDSKIRYTGRIDFTDSLQPRYSFPGISIEAKFNGSGISAIIHDYGQGGEGTTNYYKVIIDDDIVNEQLKMNNGENTYVLISDLPLTDHTIKIIKITEGASGVSSFIGFKVQGGSQKTLELSTRVNKKIEFIGDSWTCGYGNLSQFSSGNESMEFSTYVAKNEDNYYAWGPISARAIGAEYHITAISGRGLYRNNWDNDNTGNAFGTLPKNYDNILEDNSSVSYDHSFHPDIVPIHLGTNDMAAEGSIGESAKLDDDAFQDTYKKFIDKILGYHPCAKIIICYGNSKSDGYPSWTKQLSRLRTISNNIMALYPNGNVTDLELPYTAESWPAKPDDCGYGDAWHPSKCSHQEMSAKLVEKINDMNVDWGNRENCPSVSLISPITKEEKATIYIYPNPARNNISLVGENVEEWKIINQLGEVVLKGTEKKINIEAINKGLYYCLSKSEGITSSTKFIKK
jgi:hypothetical protein